MFPTGSTHNLRKLHFSECFFCLWSNFLLRHRIHSILNSSGQATAWHCGQAIDDNDYDDGGSKSDVYWYGTSQTSQRSILYWLRCGILILGKGSKTLVAEFSAGGVPTNSLKLNCSHVWTIQFWAVCCASSCFGSWALRTHVPLIIDNINIIST